MSDATVAILELGLLDEEIARCEEALRVAKLAKVECLIGFCASNPLSNEFIWAAALRVRDGGPLCCEKGLEWLKEQVGNIWAPILNDWAYDALACSEDRPERLAEYAMKVVDTWTEPKFPEKQLRAQEL